MGGADRWQQQQQNEQMLQRNQVKYDVRQGGKGVAVERIGALGDIFGRGGWSYELFDCNFCLHIRLVRDSIRRAPVFLSSLALAQLLRQTSHSPTQLDRSTGVDVRDNVGLVNPPLLGVAANRAPSDNVHLRGV